ncbi:BadM/Rrf2 family transcriptional regulator [Aquimarina sp. MAR_2010_214]|uniref:RrF2 family transcriptional regulator n=1 Tax=Aquimarina sp. MAR_2010_214 TaxID=1250026 RepID=UPI000C70BAAF|nr:Rrf2 family transcriptional regulator [Aquimarina sp. MAR_2010_214]PKV52169.1 BadM/Rrf2 family transcriptional regulator [Aquimarina sp. MAR_2010_214]
MFSKACEYGIKASIYVAQQSLQSKCTNLKAITKEINSPEAFTAKILQQLVKNKILDSIKGPKGGFLIEEKRISEIMLEEIVYAIDGANIYSGCGLGLKECNAHKPCPVHDKFLLVRKNLKNMLEATSLYELANGLDIGMTYLNR